ncbi:sensor histidine kinase [Sphingomicrobium flavum]|uniref:sensor histidine kinase n=1 Tax=Sphingomicrobium flavum TaxID=1229164 RepID=UPI0021AD702A|nr:sensor histidine kinase [Sphingomicrobium flavum]
MNPFIDIAQYMPHGMCLLWQPWLITLWAGSDLLIFLSYMAIPIALLTVLKKRGDIPHRGLIVLFASFILLCGLTHLMGIVTLWQPIYPYVGILKLATGIVSMITALVLFRLIPTLVSLPSPAHLREVNEQLRAEAAAHEATLASLESKVEQRTEELNELNTRLAVQAREAVHRSRNLLSVVSSLASQSARGATSMDDFLTSFHGRVGSLADATALVVSEGKQSVGDLRAIIDKQLEPLIHAVPDQVRISGTSFPITAEAAQQLSLALHELATNAQKYFLPRSADGIVEISWDVHAGPDELQAFDLVWREHGGEAIDVDFARGDREGFGSKLLNRIVPAMLKGEATRSFEMDSFTYRLIVPLDAVAASVNDDQEEGLAARLVDRSFGIA